MGPAPLPTPTPIDPRFVKKSGIPPLASYSFLISSHPMEEVIPPVFPSDWLGEVGGVSITGACGRYAPSGKHHCFQLLSVCSSAARDRSDCRNHVKGVLTHLKALLSCEGGGREGRGRGTT
ncbi:unnamed protein product, partial [Onchocerca flexuosa]|uniref:Uncharacterized protein n=1 Tax=Onchocerca flexuosa TaxID=387005 RepID=A0A183I7Z6_9BILA